MNMKLKYNCLYSSNLNYLKNAILQYKLFPYKKQDLSFIFKLRKYYLS